MCSQRMQVKACCGWVTEAELLKLHKGMLGSSRTGRSTLCWAVVVYTRL